MHCIDKYLQLTVDALVSLRLPALLLLTVVNLAGNWDGMDRLPECWEIEKGRPHSGMGSWISLMIS